MLDPETKSQSRSWTLYVAIGGVVLIGVLLFAVPGYIAGIYCYATKDVGAVSYILYSVPEHAYLPKIKCNKLFRIFVAPSILLRRYSEDYDQFFVEQFNDAHGFDTR